MKNCLEFYYFLFASHSNALSYKKGNDLDTWLSQLYNDWTESEQFVVSLTKSMRILEGWTGARFWCRLREDVEPSFRFLTLQIYQAFYTFLDKKR